jgi:hypothetical protein
LSLVLVAAVTAMGIAALAIAASGGTLDGADVSAIAGALATAAVGCLIVRLQPGNRLGWVFLLLGLLVGFLPFSDAYSAYVAARGIDPNTIFAWFAEWWWIPMNYSLLVFWPFLFPDGRLPGPRWRVPFGVALASCVLASVVAALDPTLDNEDYYEVSNPIGIHGIHDIESGTTGNVLLILTAASALAAAASLIVRFRRSRGVERQQIKLIVLSGVALVVGFFVLGGLKELGLPVEWVYGVLLLVVPVTVGIAILRHGLFDVDLVIRRTVVYGAVSVLLGLAYAGLVLAGQAVFSSFAGGSNLAIAVSTLVVAALFLPVRSRVQRVVDRRFYRRRYDAQQTLAAFGARLRQEVELETLTADLRRVVGETMQPVHLSIWLREAR